jgi:hypothetical protein
MKLKNASAIACAVALFFSASTSISQGNGAQVELVPLDGQIVFNPCTFEDMMLSGSFHLVSRTEEDANGGFHSVFNAVGAGTLRAVGMTTGQRYKIVGTSPVESLNISGSGTETFSVSARYGFVSQGSDANFFITFVIRVVINANGVQTVDNSATLFECR